MMPLRPAIACFVYSAVFFRAEVGTAHFRIRRPGYCAAGSDNASRFPSGRFRARTACRTRAPQREALLLDVRAAPWSDNQRRACSRPPLPPE